MSHRVRHPIPTRPTQLVTPHAFAFRVEYHFQVVDMNHALSRPILSNEGLSPAHGIQAVNEFGDTVDVHIPGELPLTLRVDGMEVVTLMTLGTEPEALALGYIRNQKLIENIADIQSVQVDWDRELVDVTTHAGTGIADWQEKMKRRIVTSGCGQGTIFSCTVDKLYEVQLTPPAIRQSDIYTLIRNVGRLNEVYRVSGAVHGCGLCRPPQRSRCHSWSHVVKQHRRWR